MTDYLRADLSHSRFEESIQPVALPQCLLSEHRYRGTWLQGVDIDGYIDDVTINGVNVGPLIEAELDRRDPDRMLV